MVYCDQLIVERELKKVRCEVKIQMHFEIYYELLMTKESVCVSDQILLLFSGVKRSKTLEFE